MKSIVVVAKKNQVQYEGGKIGYGGETRYGNSRWEYAVRLSARAASSTKEADVILYWDCGRMDWGTQYCRGVIYKPATHQIIALKGSRDCGIHTSHPTHLGLEVKKTWRLQVRSYDRKRVVERVDTDIPSIQTLRKEYQDCPVDSIPFPCFDNLWE